VTGKDDRHDCEWADVNQNGRLDLYCSIGAEHGTGTKANEMWLQFPATFRDKAQRMGVADPYGRGRHLAFIDVNHDPFPDLYVGNACCRPDGNPSPNRLFINMGGTSFQEADIGVTEEIGSRCAQAADFDNDGWEDLLACPQPRMGGLRLYRNSGGPSPSFTDVSSAVGLGDVDAAAILADMNGDGPLDLVDITATTLTVRLQDGGQFEEGFTKALTAGNRVAAGDVDGDSDLDLYVQQGGLNVANYPDLMLLNDGTGMSFSETSIPQTDQGQADDVTPIDYDRNGLTDFIVLNGARSKGPIQLIAFFPA
jgi:VCBS repeat protein